MKLKLILLAVVCLAPIWALPVPDEEVPIPTDLGVAKNELRGKNAESNTPIEPAPASAPAASQPQVVKIESKSAATAAAAVPVAAAAAPAVAAAPDRAAHAIDQTAGTAASAKERANAKLKLEAPDLETAPAIPQKNIITEEVKSVTASSAEPKPKQDRSSNPIETPKSVPIPAANIEVQKQIVEEAKPAVLNTPAAAAAAGKSAVEPAVAAPKSAIALDKPILPAVVEPKEKSIPAASEQKTIETKPEQSIQVIAPAAEAEKRQLSAVDLTTPAVAPIALPTQPGKPKNTELPAAAKEQAISTTSAPLPLASSRANNNQAELKTLKTEEAPQKPILPDITVTADAAPAAIKPTPEAKKIDAPPAAAAAAIGSSTVQTVAQNQEIAAASLPKRIINANESDESAEQKSDDLKNKSLDSKESDESAESNENISE